MKRTTYIILGLIPSGIILMLIAIYCISLLGVPVDKNPYPYKIEGKMTSINLSKCKVLKINDLTNDRLHRISFDKTMFSIASTDNDPSMEYPAGWAKRLSTKIVGDTLMININMADVFSKDEKGIYKLYDINSLPIKINLNTVATYSFINTSNISNTFDNFNSDSIMINNNGNVDFNNAHITSLNIESPNINFKSGEVKNLYMNLDNVNKWDNDATNFIIDNAYLSGKGNPSINIKGIKQVYWNPLTKESKLTIRGNEKIKIYEE